MKIALLISAILVLVVAVVFIAIRIVIRRLEAWANAMILSFDWESSPPFSLEAKNRNPKR